jgi:hypothetical protein
MADAMAKGITGLITKRLLRLQNIRRCATIRLKGLQTKWFISIDDDHESVSKTLETI